MSMRKRDLIAMCKEEFQLQSFENHYLSEASVQLKMGIEIFKRCYIEPRMEYGVRRDDGSGKKDFLDILFHDGPKKIGIELKYKTRRKDGFHFTNQGAQNNGKYDFIKDICRLERFKAKRIIDVGFAVFLTNDETYWSPAERGSMVKPFDLVSGNELKRRYVAKWKGRSASIKLDNSYKIRWHHSHERETADIAGFSFCIVVV